MAGSDHSKHCSNAAKFTLAIHIYSSLFTTNGRDNTQRDKNNVTYIKQLGGGMM